MSEPPIEFSYEYTDDLVHRVTQRFFFRRYGTWMLVVGFLSIASIVMLLESGPGFLPIAVLVVFCLYPVSWFQYRRRALAVARSMPDRTLHVTATDDDITFATTEHRATLVWGRIREAWLFPDVWLLFPYTGSGSFTAAPVPAFEAHREFFLEKLTKAGTKLVRRDR